MLVSLVLLLACTPGEDTASTIVTTTMTSTGTATVTGGVSDLSASVHAGMGSILEVTWTQHEDAITWLEFSFDEGEWWSSPATARTTGAASERVLGAPFDAVVTLRVAWEGGQSEELTTSTGPLPSGAPAPAEVSGDATGWDTTSPWVLLCIDGDSESVDGPWSFIVDRRGRTVWARPAAQQRKSLQTQLSHDGRSILIDQNTFWEIFDFGAQATIERVALSGGTLESWATPGLHHPFTQLADGSIAWGAIQKFFEDEFLTVLAPDGTQEVLWSCGEFLATEDGSGGGTCGSNTLFWDEETDRFLYSFFSIETLVEVDRKTGETVRYFGHTGRDAWGFDPEESAFWWQHGVHYTADRTILVSSKGVDETKETVLREYALDEERQVLVEVFSFGEGEGVYGDVLGEADYTAGGNILHNYGDASRLREITPDGDVVWDVLWDADYIGRSTPLSDLYVLD